MALQYADVFHQTEGHRGVTHRVPFRAGRFQVSAMERSIMTKDTILQRVLANDVCKGVIGIPYIREQIVPARTILVAYGPQLQPLGFVLAYPTDGQRGLHVSILCAHSVGRHMLDLLFQVATDQRVEYVELDALPHVLSYYPQFGFEHRKSCRSRPTVGMPEGLKQRIKRGEIQPDILVSEVQSIMKSIYELRASQHSNNESDVENDGNFYTQTMLSHYWDLLRLYDDNEFIGYLNVLKSHGYGATENYVDEHGEKRPCTKNMSIYDFLGRGCHENGFRMKKCMTVGGVAKSKAASKATKKASKKATKTRKVSKAPKKATKTRKVSPVETRKASPVGHKKVPQRPTLVQRLRSFFKPPTVKK